MRATTWVLALSVLVGCDRGPDPSSLPEWTPDDHQPSEASAGDGRAAPPEAAEDPRVADARLAASLFRANCATCHGATGRGDGPARPPGADVPDLARAEVAALADAELTDLIANGRGLMPGFAERLSPRAMALLAAHVRALAVIEGARSAEAPSEVPAQ